MTIIIPPTPVPGLSNLWEPLAPPAEAVEKYRKFIGRLASFERVEGGRRHTLVGVLTDVEVGERYIRLFVSVPDSAEMNGAIEWLYADMWSMTILDPRNFYRTEE